MAQDLTPEQSAMQIRAIEQTFGLPPGLLLKDPHAAAVVATLPPLRPHPT